MISKRDDIAEVEQPVLEMVLPKAHYLIRLINAIVTFLLAGRGTFKTTKGIALYVIDKVYEMPRSTGVGVGLSFEHLGDNTIPPLLEAFEEFGFKQGEHYVIGKKPPAHWPRPYGGVLNDKYDHVITWHNGTVIYLVSLVKKASANGISAQWGFFDEVKFMDEKVLVDEIFPIFRAKQEVKEKFQDCPGYLSKFFCTDKLADPVKIKWLLNKRKLVKKETVDVVITLGLHLQELKNEYAKAGINRKQKLEPDIKQLETKLNRLRKNMVYVAEISAYDVLYTHGPQWLKDKLLHTKKHEFKVIYENKDPVTPGESFYPDIDIAKHVYYDDNDIDPNKPFIIAPDYQHSIAPISIAQLSKLPRQDKLSLNYVDNIFAMPDLEVDALTDEEKLQAVQGELQEAVQHLCDRHRNHINKKIYFVFDQTATGKRVNADQYFVMVKKILKRKPNGWKVVEIYTGEAPEHYMKHQDTREWLTEADPKIMPIRINGRCTKLLVSIQGAAATTKNGKTQKEKKDEKQGSLDQSETTHFSDTFDMINHAVLKMKRIKHVSSSGKIAVR
jgi:hypothetical protein